MKWSGFLGQVCGSAIVGQLPIVRLCDLLIFMAHVFRPGFALLLGQMTQIPFGCYRVFRRMWHELDRTIAAGFCEGFGHGVFGRHWRYGRAIQFARIFHTRQPIVAGKQRVLVAEPFALEHLDPLYHRFAECLWYKGPDDTPVTRELYRESSRTRILLC